MSDDVVSNSAIHDDLATLQRETFDYFIREANPANGLIRDKTSFAGSMVVSAVDIDRPEHAEIESPTNPMKSGRPAMRKSVVTRGP